MFSKFGLAAATLAVGSFLVVGAADAAKRNGSGKRGTKVTTTQKKTVTKKFARKSSGRTRTVSRKVTTTKVTTKVTRIAPRRRVRIIPRDTGGYLFVRPNVTRRAGWFGRSRWRRPIGHGCRAVARRRGGTGGLIGISAHARGFAACRRAMFRCNRKLYYRKSTGRNPFAACVIAYRG